MKRRALLLLLASSGCQDSGSKLPFSRALLAVAKQAAKLTDAQIAGSISELLHLADMAREALQAAPSRPPAAVVSELLFGRLGFSREVDDEALDFVLLPSVLRGRRGSCVGLGTLFLGLSEALGWSAAGVMMPGHFYVRVAERAQHRNVELLRKGEAMPDAWYEQRFPVAGGAAAEYARPLSSAEVLGVVEYNIGNELRRARRFEPARAAFGRAVAAFPDFSEAHASLGAMQQLLGQLEEAAQSYRVALAKNPHLPGLDRNLALLENER
jgi:regulator of sirC expression with transglutaminase-like and TPR domain